MVQNAFLLFCDALYNICMERLQSNKIVSYINIKDRGTSGIHMRIAASKSKRKKISKFNCYEIGRMDSLQVFQTAKGVNAVQQCHNRKSMAISLYCIYGGAKQGDLL